MSDRGGYSPHLEAEVMARFEALDGRAARVGEQRGSMVGKLDDVIAGADREAGAFALFRAGVAELSAEASEVKELVRRVDERLTAMLETRSNLRA
jgi:hypothetical protein